MKNLKKMLALVLALMMVLSMMVTASAATFDDDADIDHKEAVDVMVAAGILAGDGTGNFNPQKALERSSAAKLIAYLMLGDAIDYVDKTPTGFSDVPAGHWASGFVAYVAEAGIVVGDGTGKYNPNGAVNGYSFAKMVMLALCNGDMAMIQTLDPTARYNDAAGGWSVAPFTGNYALKVNLGIATLKKTYGVDLKAGLEDISMNANLSREHAAQMVFNALNDFGILETVYGLTKEDYVEGGLDGYVWYYTAKNGTKLEITEPVITDTYVESFASGTTYGDVMKALGITKKSTLAGVNFFNTIEGNAVDPTEWIDSTEEIPLATNLDVYLTADGQTLKFMYTEEELALASVANTPVASGTNKGLYKWTFGKASTYAPKNAYVPGAAYLVVIGDGELVAEPKMAEVVSGKVMSKGSDYVRINGVMYTFKYTSQIPANLGVERVLYLATDGTVLNCTKPDETPSIETAETLVYVLGYYSVRVPATAGKDPVYNQYGEIVEEGVEPVPAHYDRYVQYVTMDGAIETALFEDKTTNTSSWTESNKIRAITIDSKTGIVTLKVPSEGAVAAGQITESGAKFTISGVNYYYKDAEFVLITGTKSKATVSSGSLKGAAATSNAWAIYTGEGTNKTITHVYYWVEATDDEPIEDPDIFTNMFVPEDSVTNDSSLIYTKDQNGKDQETTVYNHTVYIGKTLTPISTYSNTITAGAKSYQTDKYGVYVEIKDLGNAVTGEVTNVYNESGYLVTVDGGIEDYDISEVPVINLSGKGDDIVDLGETITYVYTPDKASTPDVDEFAVTLIYILTSVTE